VLCVKKVPYMCVQKNALCVKELYVCRSNSLCLENNLCVKESLLCKKKKAVCVERNNLSIEKKNAFFGEQIHPYVRPYVHLSVRKLVSETKLLGFLKISVKSFVTKRCQASMGFRKICTVTAILYLSAYTNICS
jgi:hypothetical protein